MSISVLQQVAIARAAYGASNADYARYEKHCTAQVAALRKKAGLKRKPPKAGVAFDARPVKDGRDPRCWAKAQTIKASMTGSGDAQKKHALGLKLSKAIKHAELLETLLNDASANSIAEIAAYKYYLKASHAFERTADANGLQSMTSAKNLLEAISAQSNVGAVEGIAYEMLEDEIEPMIRVTKHRLSAAGLSPTEKADPAVEKSIADLKTANAGISVKKLQQTFPWRGQTITVRNPKLVRKVNDAEKAVAKLNNGLETKKVPITLYEAVLGTLADAEDIARSLMEENQMALDRAHSARFESASVPLRQAREFLAYRLLRVRIARDHQLIQQIQQKLTGKRKNDQRKKKDLEARTVSKRGQAKSAAAIVKLLDGVISSFEQMQELGIVEQDVDLSSGIDSRLLKERALRCQHLATVYSLLGSFEEAVILNENASLCMRQARSTFALEVQSDENTSTIDSLPSLVSQDLENLESECSAQADRLQKAWFAASLEDSSTGDVDLAKLSLKDGKIARPLFFDISYNYATEIDTEAIHQRATGAAPPAASIFDKVQDAVETLIPTDRPTADKTPKSEAPKSKGIWGSLFGR